MATTIVISCVAMRQSVAIAALFVGQTNGWFRPRHRTLIIARGGAGVTDEELDSYIEKLVADVDKAESVADLEEAVDREMAKTMAKEESDEEEDADDSESEEEAIAAADPPTNDEEQADQEDSVEIAEHEDDAEEDEEESDEEEEEDSISVEAASAQKETETVDDDEEVEQDKDGKDASVDTSEEEPAVKAAAVQEDVEQDRDVPSLPTQRPNAIYRFLLNQGRIGHIIVMFCVMVAEFIQTYIPPLATLLTVTLGAVFGGGGYGSSGPYEPPKKVNDQYAAFVDGRSMRGKQKKKARKKADQEAAEQLRRLGNVNDAKYRLVSESFLQRHKIGPYRSDEEHVLAEEAAEHDAEADEDEDVDWVVQALTSEKEPRPSKKKRSSVEPTVSVGLTDTGMSVGVGFSIGKPSPNSKRKKKSSKSQMLKAVTANTKTKAKKRGPRVSDRDGGVMGRLRDFGANSLVSRSLLGAYSRDALPPSEAGSAHGLTELADKYGYGEWSDDEEDVQDDANDEFDVPKRRKKTTGTSSLTRRRKRRKSKQTSVSFEFDLNQSSRDLPPTTSRRPRMVSKKDSSKPKPRSSKMVRLPTERLREKTSSRRPEKDD